MTGIHKRRNSLIRPAVANVDQALVIFAMDNPKPNFMLLDRFLIMMEREDVPAVICFNKKDLATASTDSTASADNTASTGSATSGSGWKCTQVLDTPSGYNGGAIRLELIQDVNGEPTATKIIDGQKVSFPYQLDVTGADGVSTGTIYLYEETDGNYQQLGTYTVTFKKAD